MSMYFLALVLLVTSSAGEPHFIPDVEDMGFAQFTKQPFDVGATIGERGYAYITAGVILVMFFALVYCHVVSVRKSRLLEQYEQQGTLPEWSPLLIDRKNIRPPPPYEQVV
ncbi:hypothetical protein CAEBREN_13280 [Caenorhabditis brenneri]|uniref:Uncharacterized protein n=1 Tax=Caenorhabditis brenneri TaxID=135651 RepID=G0NNA2_CAEBE|nr:hypothetical protein CAEBREN_13280 [Caenorhabditis brenneri]